MHLTRSIRYSRRIAKDHSTDSSGACWLVASTACLLAAYDWWIASTAARIYQCYRSSFLSTRRLPQILRSPRDWLRYAQPAHASSQARIRSELCTRTTCYIELKESIVQSLMSICAEQIRVKISPEPSRISRNARPT